MEADAIKTVVKRAVVPLENADLDAAFWGNHSNAGRSLPPYYLVYFLLVDLLGFRNLGRSEKISFSIPIQIGDVVLMVEHRKFGLGIFTKTAADEPAAQEAAKCIHVGVKAARPYFELLADTAAKGSKLNVENNAKDLFDRFAYLADWYADKSNEADVRKGERIETDLPKSEGVLRAVSVSFPSTQLSREARWLAISAIEAFFSWTEHVFILIAILRGRIATGEDVASAASADWKQKFKLSLDISEPKNKALYDKLTILRMQVRNSVAHGAFGKNGQAMSFHSNVGSVPLLLPHRRARERFQFGSGVDILPSEAIKLAHDFTGHLWSEERLPAKIYIDTGLPLILNFVGDGKYEQAMASVEEMKRLTDYLIHISDTAANMDW